MSTPTKAAVLRRIQRTIKKLEFLQEVERRRDSGRPLTRQQMRRLLGYISSERTTNE